MTPRVAAFHHRSLVVGVADRPTETASEVLRLVDEGTCRYCGIPMRDISEFFGRMLVCSACGYWGGRGTRDLGNGPWNHRGALGVVRLYDLNAPELPLGPLLRHLRSVPDSLLQLSPFRAERVVMDLLKESLACEVRPVGGVKDGGVDGYIVAGDELKTIVQVRWHRDTRRAESVRVVREIAGTLVARGVPHGLLVTTRERMSPDGEEEIAQIARKELVGLGPLRLEVRTYQDVLDMLELAWANMGSDALVTSNPWLDDTTWMFE